MEKTKSQTAHTQMDETPERVKEEERKDLAKLEAWRLEEIADEVKQRVTNIKREIYELGRLLTTAKGMLEHGEFKEWIESNFDFSYQTANNFMNVYKHCLGRPEIANTIKPSVLYTVTSPKFPKDLREFLFEHYDGLEDIQNEQVKDICTKFKQGELDLDSPEIQALAKHQERYAQYSEFTNRLNECFEALGKFRLKVHRAAAEMPEWPYSGNPGESYMALPKRQAEVLEKRYREIHEVIDSTKPKAYVALDKTDLKPIPFEDWEDPGSHTAKGISPEDTVVNKESHAKYTYREFKSLLKDGHGSFYKEEIEQEELFKRKVKPLRTVPGRGALRLFSRYHSKGGSSVELDREHLLNVLDHLKPAIPKKGNDEDLLRRLIFTGTDLVAFSEMVTIAWPLKVDFATVVPSEELVQMVKRMDGKTVNLAYSKEHLNIASGNIRARLKTEPQHASITEAQVAVLDVANQADWYTLPKNFMTAIKLCMYSASKDTSQRHLMCVHITGNTVVASDDYRISQYKLDDEIPFDILIPASTCAHMVRFKFDRYAITDSWYMFLDPNNVVLASRVIEEPYGDITHFMDFEGKKCVLPEGIKKHLETVSVMTEGKFDIEQEIKIWLDKGQIKLKGEKETGWAEAVVKDANLDPGGGVIFTINPTFLVEMLALTDNTIMLGPKGVLFKKGPFTQLIAFLDSK